MTASTWRNLAVRFEFPQEEWANENEDKAEYEESFPDRAAHLSTQIFLSQAARCIVKTQQKLPRHSFCLCSRDTKNA